MDWRTCFLSASRMRADHEIVDLFLALLREYGVKVLLSSDLRRTGRPQSKIEDYIRESDVFVGIVTKHAKIKEKKKIWRGSLEVQEEVAIACSLRKPISVFVEDGVQLEQNVTACNVNVMYFDRENLASIKEKAGYNISALLHLSEYLRAAYGRE